MSQECLTQPFLCSLQESDEICEGEIPIRSECRLVGSGPDTLNADAGSSNDVFEVGFECTVDGLLCLAVNQTGGDTDGDCEDFEVRYVCEVPGQYPLQPTESGQII